MAQGFQARVAEAIAKRKEVMEAVYRESAQRVVEIMQTPRSAGGAIRIDTGFLRASIQASIGGANFSIRTKPAGDAKYTYDGAEIALVIANAEITDTIYVAYTANYARPREYGARGQPGDRWVGLAAQQWQRVVNEVVSEVNARIGR